MLKDAIVGKRSLEYCCSGQLVAGWGKCRPLLFSLQSRISSVTKATQPYILVFVHSVNLRYWFVLVISYSGLRFSLKKGDVKSRPSVHIWIFDAKIDSTSILFQPQSHIHSVLNSILQWYNQNNWSIINRLCRQYNVCVQYFVVVSILLLSFWVFWLTQTPHATHLFHCRYFINMTFLVITGRSSELGG